MDKASKAGAGNLAKPVRVVNDASARWRRWLRRFLTGVLPSVSAAAVQPTEMEKDRAGNSHGGRRTSLQVEMWSLASSFMAARAAPLQLPALMPRITADKRFDAKSWLTSTQDSKLYLPWKFQNRTCWRNKTLKQSLPNLLSVTYNAVFSSTPYYFRDMSRLTIYCYVWQIHFIKLKTTLCFLVATKTLQQSLDLGLWRLIFILKIYVLWGYYEVS